MPAPVCISQRGAARALGVSRKLLAQMVKDGRLRVAPGTGMILADSLVEVFGQAAQVRLEGYRQGRAKVPGVSE